MQSFLNFCTVGSFVVGVGGSLFAWLVYRDKKQLISEVVAKVEVWMKHEISIHSIIGQQVKDIDIKEGLRRSVEGQKRSMEEYLRSFKSYREKEKENLKHVQELDKMRKGA